VSRVALPREESCCCLQDFDGFLELAVLAFELPVLPCDLGGHTVADPGINLNLRDPPAQRLRRDTRRLATAATQAVRVSYSSAWSVTNRTARVLNSSSYFFGMMRTTSPRKRVRIKHGAVQLAGFDVILAMRERTRFDAALLDRLPRLKLLVTTGMLNAAIDLDAARARGVTVCGTRMLYPPPAELTWGLLLALARHIPAEADNLRNDGRWQVTVSAGLSGKALGVIGLGRLGAQVAGYARAFGMPVLAWSRNLTAERCASVGVEQAFSLEALLHRADVVTIHVVLCNTSRGMVGPREVALLKPTALLINTSRGPLIDETALLQTLSEQRIAGAALDVFDDEPLPPTHPLRTLPNVLATPHIGYVTTETIKSSTAMPSRTSQPGSPGNPSER
jgi:phosphoglycerate dehydrogenase-like enzyme